VQDSFGAAGQWGFDGWCAQFDGCGASVKVCLVMRRK